VVVVVVIETVELEVTAVQVVEVTDHRLVLLIQEAVVVVVHLEVVKLVALVL
jgi:hypothetical protein